MVFTPPSVPPFRGGRKPWAEFSLALDFPFGRRPLVRAVFLPGSNSENSQSRVLNYHWPLTFPSARRASEISAQGNALGMEAAREYAP